MCVGVISSIYVYVTYVARAESRMDDVGVICLTCTTLLQSSPLLQVVIRILNVILPSRFFREFEILEFIRFIVIFKYFQYYCCTLGTVPNLIKKGVGLIFASIGTFISIVIGNYTYLTSFVAINLFWFKVCHIRPDYFLWKRKHGYYEHVFFRSGSACISSQARASPW